MWLFVLLIVLLAAAAAYLFNIEEKVKESGELREAKEAAEKANRAKTDFLANISHEIRTPINAVMGMNEMIMRETDNAAVTEYALNINRASHNLLALVNDLLDFSKIEAGKMEIVEHEYLLSSMLNDIVNMIRIKADQKGLRFNVEVDGNLPDRLYGDDVRIRQIAVNLLNNAVKYTPRGEVKLAISGETDKNGVLKLKIAVTDTGIGIKQEDIPLLFRDFQRLDMDKNRTIEGTGLGLAITSRLTERMNGTIGVESVYGKGSTFTAVIPQETRGGETVGDFRYKHKLYIQQKKKYRESFVAPEAKVLAVDDNEMNLYVVKGLLKKSEIRITTCSSGKDALAKMCEEKYDLILLDHMMPGMDGIETLRASKKLEGNLSGGAPVIALTANAVSGVREMYLKEGFDDYLSKPVKSAELEEMMIKYLPAEKVTVTTVRQPEESKISGRQGELIDTATGLVYCAESREMYAEMLRMFADEYADALKLLNGLKNAYDWKNYTVKIHALKSSAKTIGALKLSELCLKLETEGKAASNDIFSQPNIDYIRRNHGKAMGVYEETVAEAKRLAKEMEEDV
jgi:CheY-like chemotaxis protein